MIYAHLVAIVRESVVQHNARPHYGRLESIVARGCW